MDRNQAKEFLPIMQAFAEGRVIECRTKTSAVKGTSVPNDWTEINEIGYWDNIEYRVKPEPKYRPFKDAEECWQEMLKHQPFGWLKDSEGCYLHIVSMEIKFIGAVNSSGNIISQFYSGFYSDYIFADGTPFGVKVEEK